MKLGLFLKSAAIALALVGSASSAYAATIGWNIKTSPTWLYLWTQNSGSFSGYVYSPGTYTYGPILGGTFVQAMCQSSNGTTQWSGILYGTKILYCK